MKKIKVSILALSVLVGGAVFASAAEKLFVASTADVLITNVAPIVWSTPYGIPSSPFLNSPTNLNPDSFVMVDTDTKGKIFGVVSLIKDWKSSGTNPTVTAQSSWIGTVSGSVKASKMGQPTVQMTIKANGYSSPSTNTLIINKESNLAGEASLNINFKSTSAAVRLNTNEVNSPFTAQVVGTSKINFKPGITLIQSQKTITETATVPVWLNSERELPMRVVSYGSKFGAIMGDMYGTASVNSKKQFTLNLKDGTGGSSLQLKGQIAAAAIINPGSTNNIVTITTVTEKGKVEGQAVEGSGVLNTHPPGNN